MAKHSNKNVKKMIIFLVLIGVAILVLTFVVWAVNNEGVGQEVAVILYEDRESQPPDTDDPFMLGQYYFNHENNPAGPYDLKKARYYYNKALRDNPQGNSNTWYQLGRIDFLEGKFDTALYKFNKQIEHFGDAVPSVYYMIGLTSGYKARQTGEETDWQKAEDGFQNYLTYNPNSPWARTDLAWVYFSQGKFEEMIPVLEEGLKTNPNQPWLLNMYGLALMNTDERESALKQFIIARTEVAKLTTENWGRAYPGNNPTSWEQGLSEFRDAIEKNIALLEG